MKFDDEVHLNKDLRGDFVFSWLREDGKTPIRVQMLRSRIEDQWGKDWQDAESIKSEFRRRRTEWIKQAEERSFIDEAGIRVFSAE